MRDISQKPNTLRTAIAKAILKMSPSTVQLVRQNKVPKGDPILVARVAAVQAAKNTSQIIPFCHPIPLSHVDVEFKLDEDAIEIITTVKAIYKTGVEMEALTAASAAALTIYDMCKMLDEQMEIEHIRLLNKAGGKTNYQKKLEKTIRAAVFVMSDSVHAGKAEDKSGKLIVERLKAEGIEVAEYAILPDNESDIVPAIRKCTDEQGLDLVITTGGTGISPRDNTPEAVARILDKDLPGVSEAIRAYGQDRNPFSMLSRASAGIRNKTMVISLPGSAGGVKDSLEVLFPAILHAFRMLAGEGHPTRESEQKEHAKK
ncbi:MAG: bifunctional molybdenum cofactor biosynthesis protein MoaC/MoaB [Terriglobales bacterium]